MYVYVYVYVYAYVYGRRVGLCIYINVGFEQIEVVDLGRA